LRHRCEAEIKHLHDARGRDHDVGRLQITMDDAFFVRGFERVGDLPGVIESNIEWQRALERLSHNQLHHKSAFFHAVDLRDVGVIERGQYLCFALEACEALRVLGERRRKNLDRYVAIELGVVCAVDFAHTARPDGRKDFVRSQTSPGGKGHGYWNNSNP